jgi:hypothetical protein
MRGISEIRRTWRRSPILRFFVVVYLIAVAGVAGMVSYGALSNLWADHRDSETGTYLALGLPALAVCVAALFGAALIWRDR